jgi:hypothetical protein
MININGLIPYEEYPNKSLYIKTLLKPKFPCFFQPRLITSGMISLKDSDQTIESTDWYGKHMACVVTDHSLSLPLPTVEMVSAEESAHYKYLVFNIPYLSLKKMFGNKPDFRYNGFVIVDNDGSEYARTHLTEEELNIFERTSTVDERLEAYKKGWKDNKKTWWKERPTKEFPVVIKLFNKDDCSYTKVCKTEKDAIDIVTDIIKSPKIDVIKETFVFTY